MDFKEIHKRLLDPSAYPEKTSHVEFLETHISRVYLTDSHAYKLKKPMNLGFLDFTTLEKRKFYCSEEVRLNRRFSPDTYLGITELRHEGGHFCFGGPGQLVDFAVRMRRLPETRMLDRMITDQASDLPAEIERLAGHLAPLLALCTICRNESAGGHSAVIRNNCEENLAQTRLTVGKALCPQAFEAMTSLTQAQLVNLAPLFVEREAGGYVRDGHGDLHARNICMTDPIRIYDCIEFCRRFRVADVAAELAFLLMDLDFRGRRDLADKFLDAYQQHAADPRLGTLLGFYKSYRAWVRGKVEALLAGEEDVDAPRRQEALIQSCQYFNLALGYHVPSMLLLVAGLMGVGKTTFATALARACGATLLRSDLLRKELAGIPPLQPIKDAFGEGLYADNVTAHTYDEIRRRAKALLQCGRIVIVDASFASLAERQKCLALARSMGKAAYLLHLSCDLATMLQRLDQRGVEGHDASDGRSELLHQQVASFDPVSPSPEVIPIDSTDSVDYNVQKTICKLLPG